MAVLIDGTPEIVALAFDRQTHLIQVLFVPGSRASAPELIGILLPELPAPLADRFIRDDDAACKQQFFNIAVAQAEPVVQPNPMADDLSWETMVLVTGGRGGVHEMSMAHKAD